MMRTGVGEGTYGLLNWYSVRRGLSAFCETSSSGGCAPSICGGGGSAPAAAVGAAVIERPHAAASSSRLIPAPESCQSGRASDSSPEMKVDIGGYAASVHEA